VGGLMKKLIIINYGLFAGTREEKQRKGGTGWILLWWNCEFVMW
jgi:hypothetical protein